MKDKHTLMVTRHILTALLLLCASLRAEVTIHSHRVLSTIEELTAPATTALVIVDMQNAWYSTQGIRVTASAKPDPANHSIAPDCAPVVANARQLLAEARRLGMPVAFAEYVRHSELGVPLTTGPQDWWLHDAKPLPPLAPGMWESFTVSELAPVTGELIFQRGNLDVWSGTGLEEFLRKHKVSSVIFAGGFGLLSDLDMSVIGAMNRGYFSTVVGDARFPVTDPARSFNGTGIGHAAIHNTAEILAAWKMASTVTPAGVKTNAPVVRRVVQSAALPVNLPNSRPNLKILPEMIDPRHTTVLVVDVQNDWGSTEGTRPDKSVAPDPAKHKPSALVAQSVENSRRLIAAARQHGMFVCYAEFIHQTESGVLTGNGPDYFCHRATPNLAVLPAGTWEAQTVAELAPQPGDIVIPKDHGDSFYNTPLDGMLRARGIRTVIITGGGTFACALHTTFGAMAEGYYPVYVRDAVYPALPAANFSSVGAIAPVASTEEILKLWESLPMPTQANPSTAR